MRKLTITLAKDDLIIIDDDVYSLFSVEDGMITFVNTKQEKKVISFPFGNMTEIKS